MSVDTIRLNTNREMPLIGLGVYKASDAEVEQAICCAAGNGYRLFDTASSYKNEDGVGRGIRNCGIPREELFITTKVWNNAQRLGDIEGAFSRSLERLQLDYVDLYLIHWPVPGCYLNTWKELERIHASGRAKAIGVSNFGIRHLEELAAVANIPPAVNQIEFHPYWYQKDILDYCREKGIGLQAYAPLARGAYLDNDIVCVLSVKYAKTPAQIGLRWILQKGVSAIPKSIQESRIISNIDVYDFEIEPEDMALLDGLDQNYRSAGIPEDLRDVDF